MSMRVLALDAASLEVLAGWTLPRPSPLGLHGLGVA